MPIASAFIETWQQSPRHECHNVHDAVETRQRSGVLPANPMLRELALAFRFFSTVTFSIVLVSSLSGCQNSGQSDASPEYMTNSIGIRLVKIPADTFIMGSPETEKDRSADEGPQHEVWISGPFWMGVYEVTQKEYQKVMGRNPSIFSPIGARRENVVGQDTDCLPLDNVSWTEAVDFCRRLSLMPAEKQAGRAYRLPTEAEWEYACRGGTTTVFHYGDSLSSSQANCKGNYPNHDSDIVANLDRPTTVGSYKPNAFGLCDMHGNVWEWCADWYDVQYYRHSPTQDPENTTAIRDRVCRGGSWSDLGGRCRSAYRFGNRPGYRYLNLGFRVVAVQHAP